MTRSTRALAALLAVVWAGAVGADDIRLANGQKIQGTVESVTATEVTIQLDGGARATFRLDALAPIEVFGLRAERLGKGDALGWQDLAEFGLAQKLWNPARMAFQKAMRIDAGRAQHIAGRLAEVDGAECQAMLAAAEHALARGAHQDALDEARDLLARFTTRPESARAREISTLALDALNPPMALQGPGGPANPPINPGGNPPPKPADPNVADPASLTGKVRKLYDFIAQLESEADVLAAEGLRHDGQGSVSGARRNYEEAVVKYEAGLKNSGLAPRLTTAAPAIGLFKSIFDRLTRKMVNALNNAAHVMVREGNYKQAAVYVDHVLRYDPANRHALKLRQEIEENRMTRKLSDLLNLHGTTTTK